MSSIKSQLKNNSILAKYRILTLAFALAITSLLVGCGQSGTATAPTKETAKTTSAASSTGGTAHEAGVVTDPKAAMAILVEGNDRYLSGNLHQRDLSKAKLEELSKGQHPHTIIITCSDSRVSPELLFDQSQGDLFVVRTAGNVLDRAAMGSIEYAAEHLHSPLIMVVGHEKCGAVTAATKDEPVEGSVQYLVNEIKPAVTKARKLGGDLVAKSVDENVKLVVETLPARSEILSKLMRENKLKIAGGTYSLSDGKVTIVSDIPADDTNTGGNKEEPKEEKKG